MFAQKYIAYYQKNPQYKTAIHTDTFLPCRIRDRELTCIANHMARFIEDYQLSNREKWAQFVALFAAEDSDGFDRGWRGEYWGHRHYRVGISIKNALCE